MCTFRQPANRGKASHALLMGDKPAISSDDQGSDAKTARAGGNDAVVSGDALPGHTRMRMRALPVVAEAGCLQHGKEFVVGEFARGCACGIRKWRLAILAVRGSDLILCRRAGFPQKIRVTMRIGKLNADRLKSLAIK